MADSAEAQPQVIADPPPRTATFAEPRAQHPPHYSQRKPAGPQLWAVVLTLGGLYYLWTRVLGKSLPSFLQRGNRTGAKGHSTGGSSSAKDRQKEVQAARERQQQRMQTAARAREMVQQAKSGNGTVRERNVSSGNGSGSSGQTIQQRQQLMKQQQAQKQKQQELEAKKKKQRQLYLKQKELEEKEEEKRRKDAELGPGWEYREDPDAASALSSLDPQSGNGGGGYKPTKMCKPRGGG